MDKAIEDGVDIISMSLGGDTPPYQEDPIAIGSFGAMEKGVLVSLAAGNGGFEENTVSNVAPWMTTVGASTIDRAFPADLVLEDGTVLTGTSLIFKGKALSNTTYIPLFYGFKEKNYCEPGSLKKSQVSGKIVVCDVGLGVFQGVVVKEAGGVGVVSLNTPEEDEGLMAEPYMIPGLQITLSSREKLLNNINSTKNAGATMVFHGTKLGYKPAPVVAFFSSRGPNPLSNYVLKPDVIAPGADPDWSPAMIKSALMTTAYTHDHDGNPILDEKDLKETNVWGLGAGHVDPEKALDPGLVYDLTVEDYLGFLCASNYSTKDIKKISVRSVNCSLSKIENPWDLNYPAISVAFADASESLKSEVLVTRTVTHVSDVASATYKVSITSPNDVTVTVDPETLVFKEKGEKQSYKVKIQADKKMLFENKSKKNDFDLGRLVWTDGKHQVTSLIVLV
ncbi:hypothetical protein EZV62_025403 [Acer yangbiense]|uniref:Subtilisin-like protease fibronectin type-III domain-containing protein n=1 Tax=Acer yangbiense TaxID=1000413 RepID=A0A5C7GXR0_9ROSI|nr:hypothetical protein EZV62_025403 [Acer yangbiense]